MNITFGKRNLIPSKTYTNINGSNDKIYGGNVIENVSEDHIVGGNMDIMDNSVAARKKRHAENHLDALASSPLVGMIGLENVVFLFKILEVLKFIGSIISMLWTLLTIYIILAIIKIIMQTIDTGLDFSHQILRGIRGIFQQINNFNLKIPTINVPDLKIPNFNTPEVDFPEINIPSIDLGALGTLDFPTLDLPSVPKLDVDIPKLTFPTIDIPQMNVLKGLLNEPINKITDADKKVPNDSIEVLKLTVMSLLKQLVPFTKSLYNDIVNS